MDVNPNHTRYSDRPVSSLDASDVNVKVLTLLYCNHLRGWFKAELFHHGFEVVLTGALRREYKAGSS